MVTKCVFRFDQATLLEVPSVHPLRLFSECRVSELVFVITLLSKWIDNYYFFYPSLDEFKRVYSNEDIKTKAIPYFWENFDKENFSIWLCEYQFPEVHLRNETRGGESLQLNQCLYKMRAKTFCNSISFSFFFDLVGLGMKSRSSVRPSLYLFSN